MATPNGPAIRQRRQRLGVTIPQLAKRLGISDKHAYNIETGHNTARIETLYRYARELGCDVDELVVEAPVKASS